MVETREFLKAADDVIVAISTPLAAAARGVVRLSGTGAFEIVSGLLDDRPELERRREARPVRFQLNDEIAVPADLWLMPGPRSYTGEDVVELHLTGSPALLEMVVERCHERGARAALPGEFTERAFHSGRLDLTQVEAVAAMIHAEGEAERRAAWSVLEGRAGRAVEAIGDHLMRLLAAIELDLDFSDQDIDIVLPERLEAELEEVLERLDEELRRRRELPRPRGCGRALLVGPANAGKSSLFNALLEDDRAIVSDHPGTTRDYLEGEIHLGNREIVVVDCAGEGHEELPEDRHAHEIRSRERDRADLLIEVVDGREVEPGRRPRADAALGVATRADLVAPEDRPDTGLIWVSSRDGSGLDDLLRKLEELARPAGSGALLHLAARHARLLGAARSAVLRAKEAAIAALGHELVACDLHDALAALREITGTDYSDEILSAIMRDFCIGK